MAAPKEAVNGGAKPGLSQLRDPRGSRSDRPRPQPSDRKPIADPGADATAACAGPSPHTAHGMDRECGLPLQCRDGCWGIRSSMRLLDLIDGNAPLRRRPLLAAAAASGLASTLVLALVNIAARKIASSGYDHVDWLLAGFFVAALAVYAFSERYLLSHVAEAVETALDMVRRRLLDLLRRADFEKLERYGGANVGTFIAGDVVIISQMTQYLSIGFRSMILVVVLMLYLAWLSLPALIAVTVVIVVASIIYLQRAKRLGGMFLKAQAAEQTLGERISDLLNGFKEIRMWSARSRDVGNAFLDASERVRTLRGRSQVFGYEQFILGEVAFYFVLATVVFLLPAYLTDSQRDAVQVTTTVLFLMGPVGILVQSMTVLTEAEASAGRLLKLEDDLAAMREAGATRPGKAFDPDFTEIHLEGVRFAYQADIDERPFSIGPIDVTFRRGDITFVTGGNGSGKTTLIRILCGLYRPQKGGLRVDDRPVAGNAIQPYRNLISPVFSDYHLFRRLYGIEDADPDYVSELLEWMKLDHVTGIRDGAFDTVDLSAGQRKRLALVVAFLEQRPVIVLDEWAADQDPGFRRKFYREMLPAMKRQGKTVIAVTHDDHYFDAADRRLHMEEGLIVEERLNGDPEGRRP